MENSSKQKLVAGISFALSIPISFYIYKKWKSHRIKKYIESIQCYNGINSITTVEKVGGPPREIFKLAKKYQLVAVDQACRQGGYSMINFSENTIIKKKPLL